MPRRSFVIEDALPKARHAAAELAGYIEKISGARAELMEGVTASMPARAIWVGINRRWTTACLGKLDPAFMSVSTGRIGQGDFDV